MRTRRKPSTSADVIAIIMGLPGWITLGLMVYFRYFPDASNDPDVIRPTGALMTGWLPIIVVMAAQSLYILGLLIMTFRKKRNKRLIAETRRLNADLANTRHEAGQSQLRINELQQEKLALDNTLQAAELSLGQWGWLTRLSSDQKIAIDHHVTLDKITLGQMSLTARDPTVRFGIYVTNKSVLEISLDYENNGQLGGTIEFVDFEAIELHGTKWVIKTVRDLPPGGSGCLTIVQRLIDNDPKVIQNAQSSSHAHFNFAKLVVNIVGGKQSPDVTARPLIMRNESVVAYPIDLAARGNRIKALSRVLGTAIQLYEPLIKRDKPLAKVYVNQWLSDTRDTLERAYGEDGWKRIFEEIIHKEHFPEESAGFQKNWLQFAIAILEDLIAKEIKMYEHAD